MSASDDDLVQRFSELDDTLEDPRAPGPRADAEVPAEAREWLADQRTVHGLLRALHTADAAAREDRVANVLAGIDAHAAQGQRRHWFAVAAAALVLGALGLWSVLPATLPTAEAAMARATDELARAVDRRFHLRLTIEGPRSSRVRHEFELVTRPGMRFLVDGSFTFRGVRVAEGRIGCDGETIWIESEGGDFQRSAPFARKEQLVARSELVEFLDVGCLDVHGLVAKLPANYRTRVVERLVDERGASLLRIEATVDGERRGFMKLQRAELLVDEETGMVTRLEALIGGAGLRQRRLVMESMGAAPAGSVDYSRPW